MNISFHIVYTNLVKGGLGLFELLVPENNFMLISRRGTNIFMYLLKTGKQFFKLLQKFRIDAVAAEIIRSQRQPANRICE